MPISLQSALALISDEFAQKVFEVIRTAFVAELSHVSASTRAAPVARVEAAPPNSTAAKVVRVGPKAAAKRGRLERRSSESIARSLDGIVALLRRKPGLRSEEIQKTLGIARNEIARPIALGISTGALRKSGEKRATKYSAGTAPGTAKSADAAPKKVARKAARKVTGAKKTAARTGVRARKVPAGTEGEALSAPKAT